MPKSELALPVQSRAELTYVAAFVRSDFSLVLQHLCICLRSMLSVGPGNSVFVSWTPTQISEVLISLLVILLLASWSLIFHCSWMSKCLGVTGDLNGLRGQTQVSHTAGRFFYQGSPWEKLGVVLIPFSAPMWSLRSRSYKSWQSWQPHRCLVSIRKDSRKFKCLLSLYPSPLLAYPLSFPCTKVKISK